MNGYTPLFNSIITSSIWNEDCYTRIVWVTMLAIADSGGVVEGSVPGLAVVARVTLDECRSALAKLEAPDQYSRTPEFEGRRIEKVDGGWRILNFKKFRDRAKSRAQYQQEYYYQQKEKKVSKEKKELTNINNNTLNTDINSQQNSTPLNNIQHLSTSFNTFQQSTSNLFILPPDLERWRDIAFTIGMNQAEADNAYSSFGANNWKRSNGIALESWDQVRHALVYWKNNRGKFENKNAENEDLTARLQKLRSCENDNDGN